MKRIQLHGKHAFGEHAFTLVDDDMFEQLNAYRWKAKPNAGGNNVYAVRTVKDSDGVWHTERMHRVVLGYSGPLDTDHIDHNSLNNQRTNLRVATRSENQLNRRRVMAPMTCAGCGVTGLRLTTRGQEGKLKYCSQRCVVQTKAQAYAPHSSVVFNVCQRCGSRFTGSKSDGKYCGESCRKKAKRARMQAEGSLAVLYAKQAAYSRERRARQRAGNV